jgi:RNA polymerase sigma-70 factor (ECF subfamily)
LKPKLSLAASAQRPLRITPLPDPDRQQYRTSYERHLGLLLINDEPAAPAGLWDHFSPMVRGLLSRTLGPTEDIEAPVEDIFLRVHRRRGQLAEPERVRQFILSSVIDRLRAQLRTRRWRRTFARLLGSWPQADHGRIDGGPVTVHRLALAELYQALETLAAPQRLAFALHAFEGLALADAAALTGMSVPAFERHLRAARRRLGAAGLVDLDVLARLARAASSRPPPTSIGRATRRRLLDRIARRTGNA